MKNPSPAPSISTPPTLRTTADAESLCSHLIGVMTAMTALLDQETGLVEAGRLGEASRLGPQKAELAKLYLIDAAAVKANAGFLARQVPDRSGELRRRHEEFQPRLKLNLAVLATAHAVTEGIIRGAASALARKAAPKTYGSSGRPIGSPARAAPPIAVCRTS